MSNSTLIKKEGKQTLETEFENYLKMRRSNATYNGIELETEGWQKEIFGEQTKK